MNAVSVRSSGRKTSPKGCMLKRIIIPIRLAIAAAVFASFLFGCIGCAAPEGLSKSLSESCSDSPEGMFVAKMPSASGMGRLIVIHLFENGNALRTNIYIGEPGGDYIEEGTWSAENGTVSVVLKNTAEPPVDVELSFRVDSGGLTSIKYDETPFDKEKIRFTRILNNLKKGGY